MGGETENRPKQKWAKGGPSPNPGGRPAVPKELREQFARLAPQAIEVLRQSLDSPDEKIRLAAAQALLDRALGRPHQSQSVEVTEANQKVEGVQAGLAEMVDDELARAATGS